MSEGLGFGNINLIKEIISKTWTEEEKKEFTLNDMLYILQEFRNEEGKKYLEGNENINLGYNSYRAFVKHIVYRNMANYDSMILLTASKGGGKSSAAIMMAREYCKILGIRFDPKRHIAYSNSDMEAKIRDLNPWEPLIADESARFASSEDWNKKESKSLKKTLGQIRTKHLFFIMCFPLKIYKLDKSYLESFVNIWIDLYARGKGVAFIKDANPVMDTWRLNDFKNVGSYTEFTSESKILEKLKKHPNFWMKLSFPKPPDFLYNKYLEVREHNVYNDNNVFSTVSKEDIINALLVLALNDIMRNDQNFQMNKILLHIKNEYDIPIAKQAIENAVSDAKQLIAKIREDTSKLK